MISTNVNSNFVSTGSQSDSSAGHALEARLQSLNAQEKNTLKKCKEMKVFLRAACGFLHSNGNARFGEDVERYLKGEAGTNHLPQELAETAVTISQPVHSLLRDLLSHQDTVIRGEPEDRQARLDALSRYLEKPDNFARLNKNLIRSIADFLPCDDVLQFSKTNQQMHGALKANRKSIDLSIAAEKIGDDQDENPVETFENLYCQVAMLYPIHDRSWPLAALSHRVRLLPQEVRSNAFYTLLKQIGELSEEWQTDPLYQLAIQIKELSAEEQHKALGDLLQQSEKLRKDSWIDLLRTLAGQIGYLSMQVRSAAFDALLHQVGKRSDMQLPDLLHKLSLKIENLRSAERSAAFDALLRQSGKLLDKERSDVLFQSTYVVENLPLEERSEAFFALLQQVGELPVKLRVSPLHSMAGILRHLPKEEVKKVFYALLEQSEALPWESRSIPLEGLSYRLHDLPTKDRSDALSSLNASRLNRNNV
jgi:hypothetical protein